MKSPLFRYELVSALWVELLTRIVGKERTISHVTIGENLCNQFETKFHVN